MVIHLRVGNEKTEGKRSLKMKVEITVVTSQGALRVASNDQKLTDQRILP